MKPHSNLSYKDKSKTSNTIITKYIIPVRTNKCQDEKIMEIHIWVGVWVGGPYTICQALGSIAHIFKRIGLFNTRLWYILIICLSFDKICSLWCINKGRHRIQNVKLKWHENLCFFYETGHTKAWLWLVASFVGK